jgi:hypothetical protein
MKPEITVLDQNKKHGIGYVSMVPVIFQRTTENLALYKAGRSGLIFGQYKCTGRFWKRLNSPASQDSFFSFDPDALEGILIEHEIYQEDRRIVAVVYYPLGCPQCSHNYSHEKCTCEMFYLTEQEFRKVDLYRAEFRLSYKKSGYYPAELP